MKLSQSVASSLCDSLRDSPWVAQWGGPGTPASRSQGTATVRTPPFASYWLVPLLFVLSFLSSVIPPRFCTHRFVVLLIGIFFCGTPRGWEGNPFPAPVSTPDAGVPPLRKHRRPGGGGCCLGLSQVTFRQFGVLRVITRQKKGAYTQERGGGVVGVALLWTSPENLRGNGVEWESRNSLQGERGAPRSPDFKSRFTEIPPSLLICHFESEFTHAIFFPQSRVVVGSPTQKFLTSPWKVVSPPGTPTGDRTRMLPGGWVESCQRSCPIEFFTPF